MTSTLRIRRSVTIDAPAVDSLLSEWLGWKPHTGRLRSIRRAVTNKELLVAENQDGIIGFIHYVKHGDIIDGGPNMFITAFFVSSRHRRKGIVTSLLEKAIANSLKEGVVGVETSTIHKLAKKLYERHHFKQTMGDIGEVFLELDILEYLKAQKRKRRKRIRERSPCRLRWSPSSCSPRLGPRRGP